jgi:hypothetical protein
VPPTGGDGEDGRGHGGLLDHDDHCHGQGPSRQTARPRRCISTQARLRVAWCRDDIACCAPTGFSLVSRSLRWRPPVASALSRGRRGSGSRVEPRRDYPAGRTPCTARARGVHHDAARSAVDRGAAGLRADPPLVRRPPLEPACGRPRAAGGRAGLGPSPAVPGCPPAGGRVPRHGRPGGGGREVVRDRSSVSASRSRRRARDRSPRAAAAPRGRRRPPAPCPPRRHRSASRRRAPAPRPSRSPAPDT